MLSKEDNHLLTRTGAGTPMGELFRRFWLPVLLSEELPERDGPQVRLKVMGESLLAFRDSEGAVGIVDPVCSHRGANLFYGRNEEGGLRCAYHGWKFDKAGRCVDMPSDPTASPAQHERAAIKSYPARESGGMVWAYMGPLAEGQEPPPMPLMELGLVAASHRFASKKLQECNWAQACEGGLDTAHFSFLHMNTRADGEDLQRSMANAEAAAQVERLRWLREDGAPRFTVQEHDAGLVLGAARNAEPGELYWRISQFLMPCHGLAPNAFDGENYHGQTWVPIDDEHCWIFCYTWNPARQISEQERTKFRAGFSVYARVDKDYQPLANRANDYLLDRQAQRRGNFTGIDGVSEQDACIQDSQGFISDRTREHLGPTDIGIVRFRRLMLKAARDLAASGMLPSAVEHPGSYAVRSGGAVRPEQEDLAAVMEQRFGHRHGYVGSQYGLQEVKAPVTAA